MIPLLILFALAVSVWLGWRVEESRRLDRAAAVRLAELENERGTFERAGQLERAKVKAANRLEIARLSVPAPVAPPDSSHLIEIAKIQAEAARDVARMQYPTAPVRPPRQADIQLPDDLEAHVLTWADEWARDDERGNLRRLYLELHTGDATVTWQKVRRSVGIGELP